MVEGIEHLNLALCALNSSNTSKEDRTAFEGVLSNFRSQRSSLGAAVQILQLQRNPHHLDLAVFAAQTIRHRVCEDAFSLKEPERQQLRHLFISYLTTSPGVHNTAVLRQVCICLATLAAVESAGDIVTESTTWQLPLQHHIELFQLLAEEGCSDWRHVNVPGMSGNKQLDWATATRERFRSWSPTVLHLLHSWLQQHHTCSQVVVQVLSCCTAWVKLGALHAVGLELAEQIAQAGLLCIQSSSEQAVDAAVDLLTELPEYAPEQLLTILKPHMLTMAQAACHAATSAGTLHLKHAAAWVRAFAAYASAVPQHVLQPSELGGSLRDALLQVSILPQLYASNLVCLPALEVWTALWETEAGTAGNTGSQHAAAANHESTAADVFSEGDVPGDSNQPPPIAIVRTCLMLLLHTAANWLHWQQDPSSLQALEDEAASTAVRDLFHMACTVLGPERYLAAATYVWQGSQQEQQQPQTQLQRVGSGGSQLNSIPGLIDQPDCDMLPSWQQQQLQQALNNIVSAPAELQLHTAVLLAAAASTADRGNNRQDHSELSSDCSEAHGVTKAGSSVVHLLSCAVSSMRQIQESPRSSLNQQQLALSFCQAVKAWAVELVHHLAARSSAGGASDIHGLLQLLLALTAHPEVSGPAASAMRAVTAAALQMSWVALHLLAPMLLQALNSSSCSSVVEQDLLASLADCLATPGMTEQQQQQIRLSAAQQLVEPGVHYLSTLLQHLQSGLTWSSMAPEADSHLCHVLARTRALLESHLLQQQYHKEQQRQKQQDRETELGAGTGGSSSCEDTGSRMVCSLAADGTSAAAVMQDVQQWTAAAADACEDTAMLDDTIDGGKDNPTQQWPPMTSQRSMQPQQARVSKTTEAATAAQDPGVELLVHQLLPKLHTIIISHGAGGKFLHHYGKCCSKLLKVQPGLLLPSIQQFLQTVVLGITRPGGCTVAEPLGVAIDLFCRHGSGVLLETAPLMLQCLSALWSLPEVSGLAKPGAGDQTPELAEQILKLYTVYAKHGKVLQHYSNTGVAVCEQALAAAVGCASCCHKRTASCALSVLSAVLAAAGGPGPQQQALLAVVCSAGPHIVQGVLGALLAPSPLARLHKATTVVLELADAAAHAAAEQVYRQPSSAAHPPLQQTMYSWLVQGASHYVPGTLSQSEVSRLAAECSSLFISGTAVPGPDATSRQPLIRSYMTARKLKRGLRNFAESHMKQIIADVTL